MQKDNIHFIKPNQLLSVALLHLQQILSGFITSLGLDFAIALY
jgi:hypothetical protein